MYRTWQTLNVQERQTLLDAFLLDNGVVGWRHLDRAAETLGVRPGETLIRECRRWNAALNLLEQGGLLRTNTPTYVSPSQERLTTFMDNCHKVFLKDLQQDKRRNEPTRLLYISDEHAPYDDPRVRNLLCKIGSEFKPHYRTVWNDGFDFQEYTTRWVDSRSPAAKLWTSDIQNAIDYQCAIQDEYDDAMPETRKLPLPGNHDIRLQVYLQERSENTRDFVLAEFYEQLYDRVRMPLFSLEENIIQMSPGLKLIHGVFAAQNRGNTASKHLKLLAGKSYEEDSGVFYNSVHGHTHRAYVHEEFGVTCYVSGMACRVDDSYPFYIKCKRPDWDQAAVLVTYLPNERRVAGEILRFFPKGGNKLACIWRGNQYVSD